MAIRFEIINFCSGLTQMVVRHLSAALLFTFTCAACSGLTICSAASQVDQSYWQTAIAGKASSTAKACVPSMLFCLKPSRMPSADAACASQHVAPVPPQGFIMANVIFMGIVFCLPLAPGLFALAVDLPVNLTEAYAGLVLPASAYVLMGKSGARTSLRLFLSVCQEAAGPCTFGCAGQKVLTMCT